MCKKVLIALIVWLVILPSENKAQDIGALLREAQQLESAFRDQEALRKYSDVLRHQPNNLRILCKVSELHALLGRQLNPKEKQNEYYQLAQTYAQRALRLNPNFPDANFVMAFALGRTALVTSGEERIKAVKDIKTFAEKTILLDPAHYKAYHVLGRWHYEVSNLNSLERWLLKVTYGSLPKSSLESSFRYYEKSRQLNPGFLINYLELAKAYSRNDNDKKAIELLTALQKLPPVSSTDITIKAEGKKLLEKLR